MYILTDLTFQIFSDLRNKQKLLYMKKLKDVARIFYAFMIKEINEFVNKLKPDVTILI